MTRMVFITIMSVHDSNAEI